MTARESILAFLVTTITDASTGAAVYRSRQAASNRAEGPVLIVQPGTDEVDLRTKNMGLVTRDLIVKITIETRGSSANQTVISADQVADPIFQAMHAAIMQDVTLGGRAADMYEIATDFQFETGDQSPMAAEVKYRVRYQTRNTDLSAVI